MPGSICDILPSAAALLGVPGADDRLALAARSGDVRRIVVVLVDGMGHRLLPALAPDAPLLASVLAGRTGWLSELRCTFPSTTPASLVSFGTGVQPGEHGVLGFTLNVPGTDRVLNHVMWRDDPPPRTWAPMSTWYERAARAGVDTRAVLPAMFAGSGLTDAAYRGAGFRGVGKHDDYAQRLAAEVATAPGLVIGYAAALDTAAHTDGVGSPRWHAAAAAIDRLLTRLVEQLPADALLLVTADHGGRNGGARFDIGTDPRLAAGLRVVAGEPRVRYLHVVDGARPDVRASWQEVLGGHADVRTRDEAIDAGLFGPVPPEHAARIGDLVVICRGDTVVLATDREPAETARLVGFHGALSPAETAIPLIGLRRE